MDDFREANNNVKGLKNGQAIPIAISQKDGSLNVDLNALESILLRKETRDLFVSVVSIAGDFRTGKSFLINTFLAWLNKFEENGEVDENWLVNSTGRFYEGFHWGGGAELDTEGILMWSKPFIIEKGDTKVAVFLIDTQGNFDQKSKRENNYKIFALSTLMSSVQNYNVLRQLQDNTFEHLQAFLTYATACQMREASFFQSMNFVVRDWSMPYQYGYGKEGGNRYLYQSWSPALAEQDRKSGASIKGSFQRVDCYLLPFPGNAVNTCQERSNLRVEEVDAEFLQQIQTLTEKIFLSEDLIIKRIDGHFATAGALYECIKKWEEFLQSESLPNIHTMTELIIENSCGNQLEAVLKQFDGFFLLVDQGTFLDWDEFDEIAVKKIAICEQSFFNSTPFGRNSKQHTNYLNRLSRELNDHKAHFEKKNRENQHGALEKRCAALVKEHRTALGKVDSSFTYERDLGNAHQSVLTKLVQLREQSEDLRSPGSMHRLLNTTEEKMEECFQTCKIQRKESYKDKARVVGAVAGVATAITGAIFFGVPGVQGVGIALLATGTITNLAMGTVSISRLSNAFASVGRFVRDHGPRSRSHNS